MAIDRTKLAAHLKNLHAVTGVWSDRFFCPFTGQEIDEHELINGHILNERIKGAARRTVIQWGQFDHHYGSHVEAPLIDHIDFLHMSGTDRIDSAERSMKLSDGTMVEAHLATSATGMRMAKKFAVMDVEEYDGTVRPYVLKGIDRTDPRLGVGNEERLIVTSEFHHEHHNAAMLKAGFLTLFEIFGYQIVFNAVLLPVRQVLAEFFQKKLKSGDVPKHFAQFMGAMTPVQRWAASPGASEKGLDSIARREFLAIRDDAGNLFSLGVVFAIGKIWLLVWMPFGNPTCESELHTLHDNYFGYIRDEPVTSYTVHPAQFRIDERGQKHLDLLPATKVEEVDYGDIADAINKRLGLINEPPLVPGDEAMIRHFEAKSQRPPRS